MERISRVEDFSNSMNFFLENWQKGIWSAMPGIIQSFNPEQQTATVQIAIQMKINPIDKSDSVEYVDIKPLLDCPVFFPSGGNVTMTLPLKLGDECLVVFASRCIDNWWKNGGYQNRQFEFRMHDLSDGFVFAGFSSLPNVLSSISTTSLQIKSNDGGVVIDVNPSSHNVSITASSINITGTTHITGDLSVDGNITATGTITP